WQEFLDRYPRDEHLPSFPIWSAEFGATYPFEGITPFAYGLRKLNGFCGTHGGSLKGESPGRTLMRLPPYARTRELRFPRWKENFIRQNRALYSNHRRWIDQWLPKIQHLAPSHQKLEWNCKGAERSIWKCLIQFRASGVRVKRPNAAPTLVSMTST